MLTLTGPVFATGTSAGIAHSAAVPVAVRVAATQNVVSPNRVRRVIRLQCTSAKEGTSVRDADMLCRQMVQSLAAATPGGNVRRVPAGQAAPDTASDVAVHLEITGPKAARLRWQHGPRGAQHTTNVQMFERQISAASPAQNRNSADALLRATPALLKVLSK